MAKRTTESECGLGPELLEGQYMHLNSIPNFTVPYQAPLISTAPDIGYPMAFIKR